MQLMIIAALIIQRSSQDLSGNLSCPFFIPKPNNHLSSGENSKNSRFDAADGKIVDKVKLFVTFVKLVYSNITTTILKLPDRIFTRQFRMDVFKVQFKLFVC